MNVITYVRNSCAKYYKTPLRDIEEGLNIKTVIPGGWIRRFNTGKMSILP